MRQLGGLYAAIACCAFLSALSARAQTPIASWHIDESVWSGAGGEVIDSSGNGFNGTAINGAGAGSGYGSFTNTAGCSTCQAVSFGNVPLGIAGSDVLTVMAWVRWDISPQQGSPWANILTNTSTTQQDVGQFWLQHSGNTTGTTNQFFEFAVQTQRVCTGQGRNRTCVGGDRVYVFSTTEPQVGIWYHVAGVYDGAAGEIRIYVNGVLEGTAALQGPIVPDSPDYQLNMGQWALDQGGAVGRRGFSGAIDEGRIFKDALTTTQIQQQMNIFGTVTPVLVDDFVARADGVDLQVTTVVGPSVLELWRVEGERRPVFTGARARVETPGPVRLDDPAPSGAEGPQYVVVDRGPGGIANVFDGGSGLAKRARSRGRWRHDGVRGGHFNPERAHAQARRWLRPQRSEEGAPLLVQGGDDLHVIDLAGDGGDDGVIVLPARVDGRRVRGLVVDGERHRAFACAQERACVLVPPQDADRDAAFRRVGVVELGRRAPRELVEGQGRRRHRADEARLVVKERAPQPLYVVGWPVATSRATHVGYTWGVYVPQVSLALSPSDGVGSVLAVGVDAVAWDSDAARLHEVGVYLDGQLVGAQAFSGPAGQVWVRLGDEGMAATRLALGHLGAASGSDALLLSGAWIERAREPRLVDGRLLARAASTGSVSFTGCSGSTIALVDRPGEAADRGFRLEPDASVTLEGGAVVAAVCSDGLDALPVRQPVRVSSPVGARGADLVVVVGARGADLLAAQQALQPWLDARAADVVRAAVVSLPVTQAAMGARDEREALRRYLRLLAAARPDGRLLRVVLVGSGTAAPFDDVEPAGLYVPSGRTFSHGALAPSDAALAMEDDGTWIPGVVVSRLPSTTLDSLSSSSSRLALAATSGGARRAALVFSDPAAPFAPTNAVVTAPLLEGGVQATVLDGRSVGRPGVLSALSTAIDDGAPLLWYVGHGTPRNLGGFVSPSSFQSSSAGGPAGMLVGLTCMAGNVLAPHGTGDFAERLFAEPAGAVGAAVLGAGLIDVISHERFGAHLGRGLSVDGLDVGEAWLMARNAALAEGGDGAAIDAFILFGDPFAQLPGAPIE